ncbi:hypothetical protein [Pontimicrobium sp. MEBiC01747]
MRYLIILFSFFTTICCSQDLEKIKQSEVVFIVHSGKDGNYETKKENSAKMKMINYNYFFSDGPKNKTNNIQLVYTEFLDFDEMFKNNPVPFFKINKSFLKKNKEIIINTKFMHEIGYNESYSLLYNAKTIFLIDKDDINNNIITVKKVRFSNVAEE